MREQVLEETDKEPVGGRRITFEKFEAICDKEFAQPPDDTPEVEKALHVFDTGTYDVSITSTTTVFKKGKSSSCSDFSLDQLVAVLRCQS